MECIAEIMSAAPLLVRPDTPIRDCARRMVHHRVRHLVVVDEDGKPIGVVNDFAVFRHGALAGARAELWVVFEGAGEALVAADVMRTVVHFAHPGGAVGPTLRRLLRGDDLVAVVGDDGALVGVLTEHDGVRVAASVLEEWPATLSMESTAPVEVANRGDLAREQAARMVEHHIRHLAVVDDGGALVGVVTYGDLLADSAATRTHLRVEDVVRGPNVYTAAPDERLADVAARMMEHRIGCLPIVDERRRPVGIVTRTDLLQAAVAALEARDLFPSGDEAALDHQGL